MRWLSGGKFLEKLDKEVEDDFEMRRKIKKLSENYLHLITTTRAS
jgi:hypothetical protein